MRTWVILIAALAIALTAVALLLRPARDDDALIAVVTLDGEVIREIDLSRVSEEYRFTVETDDGGVNEILVRPGHICVSEANCRDRICVLQGWLPESGMPIVCMPHRLTIEIKGMDASAGLDGASR